MARMPRVPPVSQRIHPIVFSRLTRKDKNFVRNLHSDRFRVSRMTILVFTGGIALFILFLMLLG